MTGTPVFGTPVFGTLADRTTGRFGRRRPWLLGGAACVPGAVAVRFIRLAT